MTRLYDTLKARVAIVMLVGLSLAQAFSLALYVRNSEQATTLLHDALLAERAAIVVRLAEVLPVEQRAQILAKLGTRNGKASPVQQPTLDETLPDMQRAHAFEHLLAIYLDRPGHQGIRLFYSQHRASKDWEALLTTVEASGHSDAHHLARAPLADIVPVGALAAEISLSDGTWLQFAAPLLTITPYAAWKLAGPLFALLVSIGLLATWVLHRWTQSLTHFISAADRLGEDLQASPLPETGPAEVRACARALNVMQQRMRRMLEDRTALAAAIAHDLGTPITRLHLRAHDIPDDASRDRILTDLDQMRRMIAGALELSRVETSTGLIEPVDLPSLLQSLAHDFSDAGHNVVFAPTNPIVIGARHLLLRRALENLIDNGIKHGGGSVQVGLTSSTDGVEVLIEDDGPGIPADLHEAAFSPFRRLGTPDVEGTGLGLSIARTTVRAMGGDILLENRPGGGLLARVRLPRKVARTLQVTH